MAKLDAIEALLVQYDPDFVYSEEFALDSIQQGEHSQVRFGTPKDTARSFAIAMKEEGTVKNWPGIVVNKNKKSGRYELLDGYTRVWAANEAGVTRFPAYLVQITHRDRVVDLVSKLNLRNGNRPSTEELKVQVLNRFKGSLNYAEIGRDLNIHPSTVRAWVKESEFNQRAKSVGIANAGELPLYMKDTLNSLHNDATFERLTRVVVKYKMGRADLEDFVMTLHRAKGESAEIALVDQKEEELQTALEEMATNKRKPRKARDMPPSVASYKNITYLTKFTPEQLSHVPADFPPENIEIYGTRWRELAMIADKVASAYGY